MSEKLNVICDICGKKYHICNSCKEIKSFTPWKVVTDTMEHYAIFLALSEYTKTKDKEKARENLLKCDLSELETFNENIKTTIKEIIEKQEAEVKENAEDKSQKIAIRKRKASVKQNEVINNDIE